MFQFPVLYRCSAVLAVSVMVTSCSKPAPAVQAIPEVGVVVMAAQTITVSTELPGRTSPLRVAQVRARVDGIVQKRLFKEGSDVRQGQELFLIDPAPYAAALASAQAGLLKAQANLSALKAQESRYKILVAGNAVSQQEYDNAVASEGQASADVAAGVAAVTSASINLGYTKVVSPISGRIGMAQVTEGAYVQSGAATLLATVQQIDPLYVDLNESSVDGLRLRREVSAGRLQLSGPNQSKVSITLEDGAQYAQTGRLEFTDITVDQGTGSVDVRAVFPNPDHVLLPGMFVRARIEEGTDSKALLVPQVGVTHDQKGQATVLIVDAQDKVVLRPIVTGPSRGGYWVVESGLAPGDRVVVDSVQKIQPGQQIKPVNAANPLGRSVSAGVVTTPGAATAQPQTPPAK